MYNVYKEHLLTKKKKKKMLSGKIVRSFCFCLMSSDAKSILGTIYKVSLFWIYHMGKIVEEVLFCTLLSSKPSVEYVISRVPAGMFPSPEHVRSSKTQAMCAGCLYRQSLCFESHSPTPLHVSGSRHRGAQSQINYTNCY